MTVPHPGRRRARRAAVQAIYQWQVSGASPHEIERQFLAEPSMRGVDAEYFHELLLGVPARVASLDGSLARFLDRPIGQVDPVSRAILRLGTFELMHRPEVPWRVIVNEAVTLARVFGAEQSHRYINGVLDRVARETRPPETASGGGAAGAG